MGCWQWGNTDKGHVCTHASRKRGREWERAKGPAVGPYGDSRTRGQGFTEYKSKAKNRDIKRTHREGEKRKKETGEMEHTCVKYTQAATMCARQQVISYMKTEVLPKEQRKTQEFSLKCIFIKYLHLKFHLLYIEKNLQGRCVWEANHPGHWSSRSCYVQGWDGWACNIAQDHWSH